MIPSNFHGSMNFNNSIDLNGSMNIRSAMKKANRRNSLNMNASRRNSVSNVSKATRRSSINSNPSRDTLTPLRTAPTKSILRRGSSEGTASDGAGPRRFSFSDIGGAPLGDGAIGYSIPLKCSSERNERTTIKGGNNVSIVKLDNSPKSRSERSMKRGTNHPVRQASSYYSDHSIPGTTIIPSIPLDCFESNLQSFNGYEDSKTSLQSSGRRRINRTVYLSESEEGSEGYDSDEDLTTQRLDEMESDSRTGDSTIDDWSIDNLSADQYQSDLDAATTPFPSEHSRRRGSSIKIPSASMDQHSNSTNQTGNRDDSERLMRMEGNNWDDQSLPTFHDEDDMDEYYAPSPSSPRQWDGEWDTDSSDDNTMESTDNNTMGSIDNNTMGSIDVSVRSRVSFCLPPKLTRQSSENSISIGDIADGNPPCLAPPRGMMTRQSSENSFSIGDFADMDDAPSSAPPSRLMYKQDSEQSFSIGDFADDADDIEFPSKRSLPPRRMQKQSSEHSITLFGNGGSEDESESDSDSDGIIRDDELFQDAIMQEAFMDAVDTDYTLSLSKTGDDLAYDENQKSIRFGRRSSDISIGGPGIDASMRSQVSRAISTISEDSFEITAESLMSQSVDYGVYFGDDESFYSSEEYSSSSEGSYDSDDEKAKEVRNGILWGIGGMGVGAVVGWIAKRFRNNQSEAEVDLDDIDTLGRSFTQSVLDDSINFTGTDQLIAFAAMGGEGGASGEIISTGIYAATSTAAPTTTAAATAAAQATAQTTMAVTAASNIGGVAVTTTTAISNSALVAGASAGVSGATTVAAGGATTTGVLAAVGLVGNGASAVAVVSSVTGAVAIAGSTYYSSGPMWATSPVASSAMNQFVPDICPHLNPDNATGTFRLTIDISGMKGQEEEWGWMPFSDGEGNNNTDSEMLKELWEELFLSTYNNITNDGCSEMFERRVIESMLCSSNHTGTSEGTGFLETEWEVTVSCWESCPTEPIFGTELERKLQPATDMPVTDPETVDNATDEESKILISMLDLQILLEQEVHAAAEAEGWEKPGTKQGTVSIKEDKDKIAVDTKAKTIAVDLKAKTVAIKQKEVEDEEKKGGRGGGKKKEVKIESSITNKANFTIISNSPYESRTKAPAALPSSSPSSSPTALLTKSPTHWPTESPTTAPSSPPSVSPTGSPTIPPTKSPTHWPTESPTTAPSSPPSVSPTGSPTSSPTQSPTDWPTESPITFPTTSSSSSPTDWPTESPTTFPTTSPSSSPTDSQSPSGSFFPSSIPSNPPTKSSMPTESPTRNPTTIPTVSPTKSPTVSPTASPTEYPTKVPTASPTNSPIENTPVNSISVDSSTGSPSDSLYPSDMPSGSPSESYSPSESLHSSFYLSGSPTTLPSKNPTNSPTAVPSETPSTSPSNEPSPIPTELPSSSPSV